MRRKKNHTFNRALFGERLKTIRTQLGMTQSDMAAIMNRTRVSYFQIERGNSATSLDGIIDIFKFFKKKGVDVSLDYLIGEANHQNGVSGYKELKEQFDVLQRELLNCQKISYLQEELLKSKL